MTTIMTAAMTTAAISRPSSTSFTASIMRSVTIDSREANMHSNRRHSTSTASISIFMMVNVCDIQASDVSSLF